METIGLRGVSFCIISAFCCCNGGERWQLATASSDAWWRKWGSPRNERGRGRIPPTPTTASRRVSQCPTSHGRHAWRKRPAGRLRISHYLILLRTSCQFKGSSWILRNGAYLYLISGEGYFNIKAYIPTSSSGIQQLQPSRWPSPRPAPPKWSSPPVQPISHADERSPRGRGFWLGNCQPDGRTTGRSRRATDG